MELVIHLPDEFKEHFNSDAFQESLGRRPAVDKALANINADYKEACGRLSTANRIAKEQREKADKLLSCLKCLVMRDLIKDCSEKEAATEIVKEFE